MRRAAAAASLILSAATWVALLGRILSDPTNHVAPDPRLAVVPFVALIVLASLTKTPTRAVTRGLVVAYALLSVLAILGAERANVLVQYERWIERGMPDRPCSGVARHLWACAPSPE